MTAQSERLGIYRLVGGGVDGHPEKVEPVTFASVGALELQHLEQWLKTEPRLLGEDLLIIASQLTGFDKTRDRPDLLAMDAAGRLVVIEIKRDGQEVRKIFKLFATQRTSLRFRPSKLSSSSAGTARRSTARSFRPQMPEAVSRSSSEMNRSSHSTRTSSHESSSLPALSALASPTPCCG